MNIEDVQELEVSLSSTSQIDAELSNIGLQGYSAYEVAVQNGYVGTEQQWLASLKGADGVVSETQIQQIETTIEQKIETKGYVKDASYTHTDNNYTTQEKTKLASLSNYDDSSIRTLINSKANTSDIPSKTSQLTNDSNFIDNTYHDTSKQNTLISGTNIKTINNQSILGEGNITISGGGSGGTSDYNELSNLPSINSITLSGNKTLSQLGIQPSGNYLINESDPTVPNHVKSITQDNITSWNNKSTFSGSYNDLTNKPNIPTKNSELTNDSNYITSSYHDSSKQDTLTSGTNIKTINNQSILGSGNITIESGSGDNEDVAQLKNVVFNYISKDEISWRQGAINYSTGSAITPAVTTRLKMVHGRYVKAGSIISVNDGYKFNIALYSDWHINTYTYIKGRAFGNEPYKIESDCYFRISVARNDDAELITDNEINDVGLEVIENTNLYMIDRYNLKEEIELENKYLNNVDFGNIFLNNIDVSTGKDTSNETRARTSYIDVSNGAYIIMTDYIYDYNVLFYDEEKNYLNEYLSLKNGKIPTFIDKEKCTYIRLAFCGIDKTASMSDKLEDVKSKLKIYTPTDKTLTKIGIPADAKIVGNKLSEMQNSEYSLANRSVNYPLIYFPTNFEYNLLVKYRDTNVSGLSANNTQGLCSDGIRYIWFTCNHTDTTNCGIVKYDVKLKTVVKEICNHEYGHGNGMCYIKDLNQLYITSWQSGVSSTKSRVSKLNADTLEFIEEIDLDSTFSSVDSDYAGIGAIAYSYVRKRIVYLLRPMTKGDDTYKGFIVCDLENNIISSTKFKQSLTSGGISCDENYIYYVCGNKLYFYDWDLNELGVTISNIYPDNTFEPEGLAKIDDVFIFNYNKSSFANIYIGKPTNFKYYSYHDNTKQNKSTLETDVKTFINKTYIESLIDDGSEVEY